MEQHPSEAGELEDRAIEDLSGVRQGVFLEMIITKTPFRMSFFGGGTDMEGFLESTVEQFCQPHLTSIAM